MIRASILILLLSAQWVAGQVIPEPTAIVALTSSPPYSATGLLYLSKADTNAPGLHNPVLVVEGFDIDNSMNWPELYDLLNQENLVEDLQAYGRDLIILNFDDSTIDILANATLVETAIAYVNTNRADPFDKFTAVGASLGGLATRKALVDMPAHGVDTWVSFDAPHEGANIPLGVQEFFEHFSTVPLSDFDAIREFLQSLDTPAARQLLLVHHSHSPDAPAGASIPERQDFVNEMNLAGYPTNCKTIAISNGSGFGEKLPFEPGDLILHWYHYVWFIGPDLDVDIHALPQSTNTASIVYSGKFKSILGSASPNEKTVDTYHPLSFDNAPGGYRGTFLQVYTNLPYTGDGNDALNTTNHCFVPTVSSLGIPIEHIETNLASHAELTALSPFDEIHYAVNNEPHVQINAGNKRWVMRAVLEDQDSDGDGYDDYLEYLLGTAYDSADSLLGVYAVIEVFLIDSKAVLTWNAYPNTQYEVWFAAALGDSWQLLETILPTLDPEITREYLIDTEEPSGFFKIVATPVDPVTD
ncbi:MAG: hypothetical protein ABFR33_07000 [Verrucomicrobiota bacterium]